MNTIELWLVEGLWTVLECCADEGEIRSEGWFETEEEAWQYTQRLAKVRKLSAVRRDRAGQIVSVVRVRVRGAA